MTIKLSFLSMPLAIVIGLLVAIGRLYGPRWLHMPLEAYVEFLRGTPLLLQLFVIYYVLPQYHRHQHSAILGRRARAGDQLLGV